MYAMPIAFMLTTYLLISLICRKFVFGVQPKQ